MAASFEQRGFRVSEAMVERALLDEAVIAPQGPRR